MAIGVVLSVQSDLGVTPVTSIPYEVSLITHMNLGTCTTAVYLLFIVIQILMLRRDFQMKNLLQIFCSLVFGWFITAAEYTTTFLPECQSYPQQLLYLGISIMLIALGILLYMTADIIPLPAEGVMQAMSVKFHMLLPNAKTFFDCTMVGIAVLLSFLFMHQLVGVREGTVIAAIGVGRVLRLYSRKWEEPLHRFLFSKKKTIKRDTVSEH